MARLKSDSSQIAFSYIKDRINKYELVPGDTVSDYKIAQELQMSRTPVREAIMNLVQFNLIKKKKTKFVVTTISVKDIREIIEVREAVETAAAKLIINNGGLSKEYHKELVDIEKRLSLCLEAKDYYNNFKYDSLFHNSIVRFSSNSRFISIMESLSIQGERLRWLSIMTPDRYNNAIEEHRNILSAIESGSIINTNRQIHAHLTKSEMNYEKITSINNWEDSIISFKQANEV